MKKPLMAVGSLLALFCVSQAKAADPTIPAWIDVNAQIAQPVASTQTATWSGLDMAGFDYGLSAGFNFTSRAGSTSPRRATGVRASRRDCRLLADRA